MSAAVTCASCNRPLRVPESVLGQTVQCPLCLDEFTAEADDAVAAAAAPSAKPAAPPRPAAVVEADPEPAPLEVEPVAVAVPAIPAARRALAFPVQVTRDPDRILRGPMDAELTADGLFLRKTRQPPAFAAVGRARYVGTNRLVVVVEGREVELAVVKPWTATYHLARDAAAFLGGKGDFPDGRTYSVPWFLNAVPPLFIALPFVAAPFGLLTDGCLGVFLWTLAALVLGGVALAVGLQPRLRPRTRLQVSAGLLGLGALLPLIAIPFTPSYTVDPALWRTFTSPRGDFSVLLPGTPKALIVQGGVSGPVQTYTIDVANPEVQYAVDVAPAPTADLNMFQHWGGNQNSQAVGEAKNRLQRFPFPNTLMIRAERDINQHGQPCHEMVFTGTVGYNDIGTASTETLVAHIHVVNDMVYTLVVRGPRVKDDSPDVLKFFNSIQFAKSNAAAPPAAAVPPPPKDFDGLLAYWSFDQDQFGAFTDESGNNVTGTAHQTTIIPDGKRGSAMHFNGRGSFFDFNDADGLDFGAGQAFTFCGWVRTRGALGVVLSNRADQDSAPVIDVSVVNGEMFVQVRADGTDPRIGKMVRGKVVNDGAWHHFATTRRQGGLIGLYIDGTLESQQKQPHANGAITTDLRALGAERYWQKPDVREPNADFTGDIDEFAVYGRALTEAEIKRLAGVGGP